MKRDAALTLISACASAAAQQPAAILRGVVAAIEPDGQLSIDAEQRRYLCEILETAAWAGAPCAPGDRVLFLLPTDGSDGVVLGRIGRLGTGSKAKQVTIDATESLALRCGDASIELRADGKLMVKGDDVLVKARGTQRIKAGSVNIN